MGRLVIDGNRVYTLDEECMKRKNLTVEKIRQIEEKRQTREYNGAQGDRRHR